MKPLFVIALFLMLATASKAAPFWSSSTPNVNVFTNSISLTFTNSQTVTNIQGCKESIQHTLDLIAATSGTNTVVGNLDSTLDGTNWYPQSTNTVSTNGIAEVRLTGKWSQFRWRVTFAGTNGVITENYMAQ